MTRRFIIEIRDYGPGITPDPLTTSRIEEALQEMLENDMSDGIIIVTEASA